MTANNDAAMGVSGGPCAVPLVELLRTLPVDARHTWTDSDGVKATHWMPIGRYAHEAADCIDALKAERDELKHDVARALANHTADLERIEELERGLRITRSAWAQAADERAQRGSRIAALEAKLRELSGECAECDGLGVLPDELSEDGDAVCGACADIRALLSPNEAESMTTEQRTARDRLVNFTEDGEPV